MPPSILQTKLDAAWDTISAAVNGAIGKPTDRAIHKIGTVTTEPAPTRVVITGVTGTDAIGAGLVETTYTPTTLALKERTYQKHLPLHDLDGLVDDETSAGLITGITDWANKVVARDALAYLAPLSDRSRTPVDDVAGAITDELVGVIRRAFDARSTGETALLLVVPAGHVDSDARTSIIAALRGDIVELPTADRVDVVPNLILEPSCLAVVHEAFDLTLGWSPDASGVTLTLSCRRSDLATSSTVVRIIAP